MRTHTHTQALPSQGSCSNLGATRPAAQSVGHFFCSLQTSQLIWVTLFMPFYGTKLEKKQATHIVQLAALTLL